MIDWRTHGVSRTFDEAFDAANNAWFFDYAGQAAMAIKSRRDQLRVIDGSRRMLAERTLGRAHLTLIGKETE